jgi:hypothetical protein
MLVTKTSIITGIERTVDIDITLDQLKRWERGEDIIQNIMPNLTANEREFIMTGMTPDEWDEVIGDED